MMFRFPILLVCAAASSISTLRVGGVVKAPTPFASGNATLIGEGTWQPHPHYAGPPVFFSAGSLNLIVHLSSPGMTFVYCVYNGRAVRPALHGEDASSFICDLSFLSYGGLHAVAAYASYAGGASLVGDVQYFSVHAPDLGNLTGPHVTGQLSASEAALRAHMPSSTGILGIYYTTYQQKTAQLYQNVSRTNGQPPLSMDAVLSSNGTLQFKDSIWKYYPNATSPGWEELLFFSQTPALGMYCYYRKRANETVGEIPDCPEASRVLQAHATLLSSAGFEFIAPDATNWDGDPRNSSNGADFNQLRPTEVLAEEWANMRLAGASTPQLSTFDQVNVGGVLYQWYLSEFFNNDTLLSLDMIFRNRDTPRVPGTDKVYIVADEPTLDYSTVHTIQANGGLHDIVTPIMWSAPDASGNYERNGYLKYFSPCVDTANGTSFFSADSFFSLDQPCNHIKSLHSPIGDVWTVSSGLPMNSIPFGGLRYNGLFLKKQFYDVFADPTPTDILFAPSFNEFAANARDMSTWDVTNPLFVAAGASVDDSDKRSIWLDGFTSERSRTVEPSHEDGGYYYDLFASCMRVYRLQAAMGVVGDGLGCVVAGEECCAIHADEEFTAVWSFHLYEDASDPTHHDFLLTADPSEAAALRARAGWREMCAPQLDGNMNSSFVCGNQTLVWSGGAEAAVLTGPLILLSNTSTAVPGTTPIVRCIATGEPLRHFVDGPGECVGGTLDTVLGYGGAVQGGLFSRTLRRCAVLGSAGQVSAWYTTTDGRCTAGDVQEAVVGYVL